MTTRIKQERYYRQFGVRRFPELGRPRLFPVKLLTLPLESIYQYWPDDSVSVGPNPSNPLLQELGGRAFIEHITTLATQEGNPRRTALNPASMIAEYRRKTRGFKPLSRDQALIINPRNTLVQNYAMLDDLFRYVVSFKAQWFKWHNIANTFWQTVETTHKRFGWNQYIELSLPATIPTYGDLKKIERVVNQDVLRTFNTQPSLSLADLWVWLGPNRERSTLAAVSDAALEKVNLVVRVQSFFFILNLGQLNRFRRESKPEAALEAFDHSDLGLEEFGGYLLPESPLFAETLTTGLEDYEQPATALQMLFVKLLHGIRDLQAGVTSLTETDEAQDAKEFGADTTPDETDAPEAPTLAAQPTQTQAEELAAFEATDEFELPAMDGELILPTAITREDVPHVTVPEVKPTPQAKLPDEDRLTPTESKDQTSSELLVGPIERQARVLRDAGVITQGAYLKAVEDANSYKTLPDPFGSGKTLEQAAKVTPEDLSLPDYPLIPDRPTIVDKSMLDSKLQHVQRKYINTVLQKDIMSAVLTSMQVQGIAVKDYQVEVVKDNSSDFTVHSVTVKPIRGRARVVRFIIPNVNQDGRYTANGTQYFMIDQRADVPIRKVNASRVSLTSYYNKTFVDRSARASNDYGRWLTDQVIKRGNDLKDDRITGVRQSDVFDQQYRLPRVYSLFAMKMISFESGEYSFFFDYKNRVKFYGEDAVKEYESDNQVLLGRKGDQYLLVDFNGTVYITTPTGLEVLGQLPELLDIDETKAPIDIVEMTISNKSIPLGCVLAYHMGLSALMELLACDVTRVPRGQRYDKNPDEYQLVFEDEVLIFSKMDARSCTILAGLNRYARTLRRYSVYDFDRRDVYLKLLEETGLGVRYLREMDHVFKSWMDDITRELLAEMGEPTEMVPLLLRAVELLATDWSPAETDGAYMRYRGYERFAGAVYAELTRSAKMFNGRVGNGENHVELNPHAIWRGIVGDSSIGAVNDSNPLANLRESEAMTYRGTGGRSDRSMVKNTRIFHESDRGSLSEASVDSGAVGVIAFRPPNPTLTSLRGTTRPFDKTRDGNSSLFSTAALLAPCVDHDDVKRIGFVSVQQAQGIFCDGGEVTPLRTGEEGVIAHRTSDIFATAADDGGEVVAISEYAIHVKYDNGAERRIELGTRYGTSSGVTYPHEIITKLKAGDRFESGTILSYNEKYFTPDTFNPLYVNWKAGVMCKIAIMDTIATLEDGSSISKRIAEKLNSQATDIRTVTVRFDQNIHNVIPVGTHVDLETILCTIEDAETANAGLFDQATMDTLKMLASMAPKAKNIGVVTNIECFYHGEFDDLSENLRNYVAGIEKEKRKRAKALGMKDYSGQVDTGFRSKGKALDPDTIAVRFYITHQVPAGVGDKGVFGNQMKTVFSEVMTGVNESEDGTQLDAVFGNTSIEDRMVHSPKNMGTTNTLLRVLTKHIVDVYRGRADAKSKR